MSNQIIQFFDTNAIDSANLREKTKMQYKKALSNYLATGSKLTDSYCLSEYRATTIRNGHGDN